MKRGSGLFLRAEASAALYAVGCWDETYAKAWLIVTDLAPEGGDAVWYTVRDED